MGLTNMETLANKYRPSSFEDITEQSIVVDMLKSICSSEDLSCRNFLLVGPAGCGKAQPMYSKVLTPSGYIDMKDVTIGTNVITHTGQVARISGIYPQGIRPIYEIALSDGSAIRVSDEHLNLVYRVDELGNRTNLVVTTNELLSLFQSDSSSDFGIDYPSVFKFDISILPNRYIERITYIGEEECQCIYVEHIDHTYISDGLIPTHNTTLGRIIAKEVNDGLGEPIEVDAASHSGVDAMREILSQARSYPVGCKWKVFIIDEVHSISSQGWQCLLKTLEENPAKSIFCLCTTNPEKIPATILSRVQTFQLSKISLSGIESRLRTVLNSEIDEGRDISYTEDAVGYLAKLANGGMRDALTLLDKTLSYDTHITSETIERSLNLPNYDDYFDLLSAYAKKDNQEITSLIHKVYNSGVNFVKWFEGFHSFVMNIVKYIFLQDINKTMIPSHYQEKISKYTTAHSIVCLKLSNKLLELNKDLRTTQYLQEVALSYLCTIPSSSAKK